MNGPSRIEALVESRPAQPTNMHDGAGHSIMSRQTRAIKMPTREEMIAALKNMSISGTLSLAITLAGEVHFIHILPLTSLAHRQFHMP